MNKETRASMDTLMKQVLSKASKVAKAKPQSTFKPTVISQTQKAVRA